MRESLEGREMFEACFLLWPFFVITYLVMGDNDEDDLCCKAVELWNATILQHSTPC